MHIIYKDLQSLSQPHSSPDTPLSCHAAAETTTMSNWPIDKIWTTKTCWGDCPKGCHCTQAKQWPILGGCWPFQSFCWCLPLRCIVSYDIIWYLSTSILRGFPMTLWESHSPRLWTLTSWSCFGGFGSFTRILGTDDSIGLDSVGFTHVQFSSWVYTKGSEIFWQLRVDLAVGIVGLHWWADELQHCLYAKGSGHFFNVCLADWARFAYAGPVQGW